MFKPRLCLVVGALALSATAASVTALACDFCKVENLTLSEELNAAEVAVIATMTTAPEKSKDGKSELSKAVFRIDHVFKGGQSLKLDADGGLLPIEAYYFGDAKAKTQFLLLGLDPPKVKWGSPLALSAKAVDYVRKLPKLPADGPERLEFFLPYLENEDAILARDAHDEFGKTPYNDIRKVKDKMSRADLLKWIGDKELTASRKRLYLMMLSICGTKEDVPMLKAQLAAKPDSNEPRLGMEPVMVAYLMLAGEEGMKTIDELFMANKKALYTDIYSAIMALRFLGQEQDRIDRKRILESFKHMLDRPDYADLVIPDLARWEDWSAMEKLVELFKTTKDESAWVRVPVIQYLMVCPLPKAKTYLKELEKIDPEAVRRANFILPLGRPAGPPKKPAPVPDAQAGEKAKDPGKAATKSGATAPAKAAGATSADEGAAAAPLPAIEPLDKGDAPSGDEVAGADDIRENAAQQPVSAGSSSAGASSSPGLFSQSRLWRWLAAAGIIGVYLVLLRPLLKRAQAAR
jgi:hypothetical protein